MTPHPLPPRARTGSCRGVVPGVVQGIVLGAALGIALLLGAPLAQAPGHAASAQETHLLIVSGLGGEPRFREEFVAWGSRIAEGARSAGVPPERVVFLAEDPEAAPELIRARSTREEVERAVREIAEGAAPEDRVLVVLIGHGSGSGAASRVSLPGASLTAAEYGELLDLLAPRHVALVNAASGSGDFIPTLAGEGRVIVTATRSAAQRNASIFGGHFAEALSGSGADLDRDGRISILEAFEYARQETERHYRDRGLIASEQALLEDRPVGRGVPLPMEEDEVGSLAARFFLQDAVPTLVLDDPELGEELRRLYAEQASLEAEFAALATRRATMDPEVHQAELEALLLELARVGQEIRRIEGEP